MAQEARQAAQISDPLNPSESVFAETATSETAAALRNRIAVLEGREHALSAELAALRADLRRLRQSLDQVLNDCGATASVVQPTLAVVPAVPSASEGENAHELTVDTVAVTFQDYQAGSVAAPAAEPDGEVTENVTSEESPPDSAGDSAETATIPPSDASVTDDQSSLEVVGGTAEVDLAGDAVEAYSGPVVDGGEANSSKSSDEADSSLTEFVVDGAIDYVTSEGEPEAVELEAVELQTAEHQTAELEAVELEAVELEALEPEVVEAESVEAEPAVTESVETAVPESEGLEEVALEAETVQSEDRSSPSVPWKFWQRSNASAADNGAVESEVVETETPEAGTLEEVAVQAESVETAVAETEVLVTEDFETHVVETDTVEVDEDPKEGVESEDVSPPSVPWESWDLAFATAVDDVAVGDTGTVESPQTEVDDAALPSVPWESWEAGVVTEVAAEAVEPRALTQGGDDLEVEDPSPLTVSWSSWQAGRASTFEGDSAETSEVASNGDAFEEATNAPEDDGVESENLTSPSVPWSPWQVTRVTDAESAVPADGTHDEAEELTLPAATTTWQPPSRTVPDSIWGPDAAYATPVQASDESATGLLEDSCANNTSSIDDALFAQATIPGGEGQIGGLDSSESVEPITSFGSSAEEDAMSQSSGPSSSEIDDLIQQAVASKEFVQQPYEALIGSSEPSTTDGPEPPTILEAAESVADTQDRVQSPVRGVEQAPTPGNGEVHEGDASLARAAISEDFFIRPVSSRKGKD